MGALLIVPDTPGSERRFDLARAEAVLSEMGFSAPAVRRAAGRSVYAYGFAGGEAPVLVDLQGGGFAACAGNLFLDGMTGEAALAKLCRRFAGRPDALDDTVGHFLVAIARGEDLWLLRDRNGAYEAYSAAAAGVVGTSFLALASGLDRLTLDRQACYEYVFDGVSLGDDTIFREIGKLGIAAFTHMGPADIAHARPAPLFVRPRDASRAELVELARERLVGSLRTAASALAGRVRLALSGGYDSRLLVGALRAAEFDPDLYVYGENEDSDVRIAQDIARSEGLRLTHLNKGAAPDPTPDAFPAVVEQNLLAGDGLPSSGIFNNGAENEARRARTSDGALLLNGGGGEVMRNFFHLPDRPFSTLDVARSFYAQFDPQVCTDALEPRRHLERIAQKMRETLELPDGKLERSQVDGLYPHFRCRSWNGRESNNNGRYGPWLLPFYDYAFTQLGLGVPPKMKRNGNFEAALIRAVDPRLAGFPSNYGYSFAADAPAGARLRSRLDDMQPPWLRQYRHRIKYRLKPTAAPEKWLGPDYAGRTMDLSFPFASRLFHPERVREAGQRHRIATLEYLCQKLGPEFGAAD